MYRYSDMQKLKKLHENVKSKSFTKKRLLDYLVECGVCSKESFVYITTIIFAQRKQLCTCAHKIMKRVYCTAVKIYAFQRVFLIHSVVV